jgi:hypothetical protein
VQSRWLALGPISPVERLQPGFPGGKRLNVPCSDSALPLERRATAGRGFGYGVTSSSSDKLKLMSALRQGVGRRLTYIPRFIHHFKARRDLGQSIGQASRSARERMRHHP